MKRLNISESSFQETTLLYVYINRFKLMENLEHLTSAVSNSTKPEIKVILVM